MASSTLDPSTGKPLPPDAIQRILFLSPSVHIYNIPPLASTKGHTASSWTDDPRRHIFTARLRVIETANDGSPPKTDVVLEDPSSGQLFAAAPYTSPEAVEPAVDSSRFFTVRVQDGQGRKAMLGIGFEERSEAFDFGIALQDARKGMMGGENKSVRGKEDQNEEVQRDYSLKEGETITVSLSGTKIRRRQQLEQGYSAAQGQEERKPLSLFALPPPPASNGSGAGFLLPPPSAREVKQQRRLSAQQMGFDDGQFGEFA